MQQTNAVAGTGSLVSVLSGLLAAVAVYSFGSAVADVSIVLAVVVNLIAAAGLAPTLWRWRDQPIWRWVVYGLTAGLFLGWFGLLAGIGP